MSANAVTILPAKARWLSSRNDLLCRCPQAAVVDVPGAVDELLLPTALLRLGEDELFLVLRQVVEEIRRVHLIPQAQAALPLLLGRWAVEELHHRHFEAVALEHGAVLGYAGEEPWVLL